MLLKKLKKNESGETQKKLIYMSHNLGNTEIKNDPSRLSHNHAQR